MGLFEGLGEVAKHIVEPMIGDASALSDLALQLFKHHFGIIAPAL